MEYKQLCKIVFDKLVKQLKASGGLSVFARHRSKFEGWLKVELCGIFAESYNNSVIPEDDRTDVSLGDWRLELKTLNTNYRFNNVVRKTRPITSNVSSVIRDIEKLKDRFSSRSYKKAVVFIVFPVTPEKLEWQNTHLPKITCKLKETKSQEFTFGNGIPGIIYVGLI
ncbi:MAG: hypothetical protein MUP16_07560 [Sedimentisphaerales bacterium]|nr:hypothetical protein [Sedimentisphaerales bacterium]